MNWLRISGTWTGFWLGLCVGLEVLGWVVQTKGDSILLSRHFYAWIAIPICGLVSILPDSIAAIANGIRRYRAVAFADSVNHSGVLATSVKSISDHEASADDSA
jgi:hypothetical protein